MTPPARLPARPPRRYSVPQLKAKTAKELAEILRRLRLPVSGKKEELVGRIMEQQRRQQRAGRPS